MSVMIVFSGVLLACFGGLLVTAGVVDGRSKRQAWARLATQRRIQSERGRALDAQEQELATEAQQLREQRSLLAEATGCDDCAVCELRRRRRAG